MSQITDKIKAARVSGLNVSNRLDGLTTTVDQIMLEVAALRGIHGEIEQLVNQLEDDLFAATEGEVRAEPS